MGLFDFAWTGRTGTGTSRFPIWYLKKYHYICSPKAKATLAQLVEQLIRNEQVVGSSPMSGSNPFDLYPNGISERTLFLPLSNVSVSTGRYAAALSALRRSVLSRSL